MSGWREAILRKFEQKASRLTLVHDPDSLLSEEKLARELCKRGFDIVEYGDSIEFRYTYESKYRDPHDDASQNGLVVVLRQSGAWLNELPYDLIQKGQQLSFSLEELFPGLSYPALEGLDRSLLDDLFEIQELFPPDPMGDKATLDYILRQVFRLDSEMITSDVHFLQALLQLHYGPKKLSRALVRRLTGALKSRFPDWPLELIISHRHDFYAFIQERWPIFLVGPESSGKFDLKYPGPAILPLDHQDIRVYLDNLFGEGYLTPIKVLGLECPPDSWVWCGLRPEGTEDISRRISHRLGKLIVPNSEASYGQWLELALKWAELSAQVQSQGLDHSQFLEVGQTINVAFESWLAANYGGLINLSPTQPVMGHHLARRLARELGDDPARRLALVVIDGLSLEQWVTVRSLLSGGDGGFNMTETAMFSWIPTVTSVARQAIFAGRPPCYFPSSINTTNSEGKLWGQYWEGQGLSQRQMVYKRGLGEVGDLPGVKEVIESDQVRVVGLVVDKVDKIMHGMELGAVGMHNQIKQWVEGGFLPNLLELLLDLDFEIWLTSDHGNLECQGQGRPSEGSLVETKGERVRVYPTLELRQRVADDWPTAIKWGGAGLPDGYFPLMTTGRKAFATKGQILVGHGGLSLEEVIVPLITIKKTAR